MMQSDPAFPEHKCARCRHVIQSEPASDGHLWYHQACLDEGLQALQRAQALAAQGGAPRPNSGPPTVGEADGAPRRMICPSLTGMSVSPGQPNSAAPG